MAEIPSIRAFRQQAAEFIKAAVISGDACPAYGAILPPDLHQQAMHWQRFCFDSSWAGVHWPVDHGGMGLTPEHNVVWHEECATAEVAPYLNLQGIVLAGEAILRSGTQEQRDYFLRPTLSNEILWCQLFSEPGAGSDLAGLQTSAVEDGDSFILNGQKVWSSNAQFAQYGILMARTDTEQPKHKGITFFLLDMNLAGIEVRPIQQMTGDSEFCEVFFTDVSLPANSVLGDLNGGWSVAMSVLQDERGGAGAAGVISLRKRLEAMIEASGSLDSIKSDELVRILNRGKALQSLMERRGGDPLMAPVAKLMNSDLGYSEAQLDSLLQGADSMLNSRSTDNLLYSPGMRIAGGSSEIQRNIIGERLLGLPREPQIEG
ncbi:MAG TPA: acyl-CoA dehydrogenase [Acidimicrobiaceae bacterium]|nr:acyl-CoA dehydrogenase [Acidimicrobiaceae bacterium]